MVLSEYIAGGILNSLRNTNLTQAVNFRGHRSIIFSQPVTYCYFSISMQSWQG